MKVPLSNTIVWLCPRCLTNNQFRQFYNSNTSPPGFIYRCIRCNQDVYFKCSVDPQGQPISTENVEVYPASIPQREQSIPTKVWDIFEEAVRCLGARAWNASATMARRAVQECVLDLGGQGKDLFNQIDDLDQKRIITTDLRDIAHEVRIIGKTGAHADVPTSLTRQDAEDAVHFCKELFDYVYVLKSRLASRKKLPTP